jgi:hypothetical protein
MKMKSIMILLVAVTFSFGIVSISAAVDVKGKIVKIQGAHDFDVKDKSGKVVHCEEVIPAGFKVGDMVTVKDGKVTKDTGKKGTPTTDTKKQSSSGK